MKATICSTLLVMATMAALPILAMTPCELVFSTMAADLTYAQRKIANGMKGIVLGRPREDESLKIEIQNASYKIERNNTTSLADDIVNINLIYPTQVKEISIAAGIFTPALAMAMDGRLGLITLTAPGYEGQSVIHPAAEGHRFALTAGVIDRWGIKVSEATKVKLEREAAELMRAHPEYVGVTMMVQELPWRDETDIEIKAASGRPRPLFEFIWRGVVSDAENLPNDVAESLFQPLKASTDANIDIFSSLNENEWQLVRYLNEFIIAHRLTYGILHRTITVGEKFWPNFGGIVDDLGPYYQRNLENWDVQFIDRLVIDFLVNRGVLPPSFIIR